jgi:hypothetical protein
MLTRPTDEEWTVVVTLPPAWPSVPHGAGRGRWTVGVTLWRPAPLGASQP